MNGTDHELGDGPIELAYRDKMVAMAHAIDDFLNDGAKGKERSTGFVLLVFQFGEGGRCNYISNGADRHDVAKLLREQLARFEAGGATL